MDDKRIRVRLPNQLSAQLAETATQNHMSLNKLIEHILTEYLLKKTS